MLRTFQRKGRACERSHKRGPQRAQKVAFLCGYSRPERAARRSAWMGRFGINHKGPGVPHYSLGDGELLCVSNKGAQN